MSRGLFVTFEGIDGCGKSTQAARAYAALRDAGVAALLTREPGGTPVAERIRSIVLDAANGSMVDECEVLLYLAARAQHVRERILPALAAGTTVLCDRFAEATFAYQGWGRGLPVDLLRTVNGFATGGLAPDHTFVFDLPVELAAGRLRESGKAPDRLEGAPRGFHEKIRQGYLAMAGDEPRRFTVLDARRPINELAADVRGRMLSLHGRGA